VPISSPFSPPTGWHSAPQTSQGCTKSKPKFKKVNLLVPDHHIMHKINQEHCSSSGGDSLKIVGSFRGEDSDGPEAATAKLTEASSLHESKVVTPACSTTSASMLTHSNGLDNDGDSGPQSSTASLRCHNYLCHRYCCHRRRGQAARRGGVTI
jgi:hypothetical protein